VINSRGGISLKRGRGFEEQKRRLLKEGVHVDSRGRIDLDVFQWEPGGTRFASAREFLRKLAKQKPSSSGRAF